MTTPGESSADPRRHQRSSLWTWGAVACILLFGAAVRFRLLDVPLERDEGEYAYAGQLLLEGVPPYRDLYTMKLPGTGALYALIMAVFGETTAGIHAGLLIANLVTAVLLFLLARHLFDSLGGIAAAGTYMVLAMSPTVLGMAAHATQFVVVFVVAALCLLRCSDQPVGRFRLCLAGLLLGLAVLIKQHALLFVLFGGLLAYWEFPSKEKPSWRLRIGRMLIVIGAATLPYLIVCGLLWQAGVFATFRWWTIDYATAYVSEMMFSDGWRHFSYVFRIIVAASGLLWLAAGCGIVVLVAEPNGNKENGAGRFVIGLTVAAILAICPGLYFRPHYFVLLLPAAAMLTGVVVSVIERAFERARISPAWSAIAALLLWTVAAGHAVYRQRMYLFQMDSVTACRWTYRNNPFPEAVDVAEYIRRKTNDGARVAILGSEPEILFYARRRSATGYIYMYPLMERQPFASQMQQEMIDDIEAAEPEFLVYVNVETSWLPRPDSERRVQSWYTQYGLRHYNLVGIVDIAFPQPTEYHWGPTAGRFPPRSPSFILIHKRKPSRSQR